MEWTLPSARPLARGDCRDCGGAGVLPAGNGRDLLPCSCIFRGVFRACYRKFRACAAADASVRAVTFQESRQGVDRHLVWFRRNEDYCADFASTGRRVLEPRAYRVFRCFHLLGGTAKLVAERLGISRAEVWRIVEEIEFLVGREVSRMRPYSLYPPREYMRAPHSGRTA